MISIQLAGTDEEITQCYSVMSQLRLHITEDEFFAQVKRQMKSTTFQIAFLTKDDDIRAVAGFRIQEMLAWGKALYVDDLVTDQNVRSKGYGGKLLDWLVDYGKENNCDQLHLDSGVQRFAAHRFYLTKGMDITCHHFQIDLM